MRIILQLFYPLPHFLNPGPKLDRLNFKPAFHGPDIISQGSRVFLVLFKCFPQILQIIFDSLNPDVHLLSPAH